MTRIHLRGHSSKCRILKRVRSPKSGTSVCNFHPERGSKGIAALCKEPGIPPYVVPRIAHPEGRGPARPPRVVGNHIPDLLACPYVLALLLKPKHGVPLDRPCSVLVKVL